MAVGDGRDLQRRMIQRRPVRPAVDEGVENRQGIERPPVFDQVLYAANTGKTESEPKELVLLRLEPELGGQAREFLVHGFKGLFT